MVGLGVESSVAARRTTVPLGRCTGWPGTVTAAARPLAAGTPRGSGGRGRLPPRSRRRWRPGSGHGDDDRGGYGRPAAQVQARRRWSRELSAYAPLDADRWPLDDEQHLMRRRRPSTAGRSAPGGTVVPGTPRRKIPPARARSGDAQTRGPFVACQEKQDTDRPKE